MAKASSWIRFGDGINGNRPAQSKLWEDLSDTDPGIVLHPDFGAGLKDFVFEPLSGGHATTADSHDGYANLETAYLLESVSLLDM